MPNPPAFSSKKALILAALVARTGYEIIFSVAAIKDLRGLKGNVRLHIRKAIAENLKYEPIKNSNAQISSLQHLSQVQYQMAVDNFCIFYTVTETTVEILAILPKSKAKSWLEKMGEIEEF
ncbi:hypothetical protein NUACC21_77150 [Scytonema sp. NUACC21]